MKSNRMLLLLIAISVIVSSCIVIDTKWFYFVNNCTNDTLILELTEEDAPTTWIYWGEHPEDTMIPLDSIDTISICRNGEKVIIDTWYYALPGSFVRVAPYWVKSKKTYNIYAIKWDVIKHYTLEEIHAKKLYFRQTVTKTDFHDYKYDFRYPEQERNR